MYIAISTLTPQENMSWGFCLSPFTERIWVSWIFLKQVKYLPLQIYRGSDSNPLDRSEDGFLLPYKNAQGMPE